MSAVHNRLIGIVSDHRRRRWLQANSFSAHELGLSQRRDAASTQADASALIMHYRSLHALSQQSPAS